ncbi:MAG TPA: hypothetical protein VGV38_04080, partial [Pyrinomonadaceae bacterium]|nr:hypothetical protein [Pyrinomonadaceae bacterium]
MTCCRVAASLLVFFFFLSPFPFPRSPLRPALAQSVRDEARVLREFVEFLSIPNLASDRENIRRNAALLSEMMRRRGLAPRLLEAKDPNVPPVVYGEWLVPGARRTLVFYAHYDGQPTNPQLWTGSLPWQPVL